MTVFKYPAMKRALLEIRDEVVLEQAQKFEEDPEMEQLDDDEID